MVHLISYIYNVGMRLKHYLNIDGKVYRSICDNCMTPIQKFDQKLCWLCWKDSIKGQVRVVHNKPHSVESKKLISLKKQKEDVGYMGVHNWLWREFPKKQICQNLDCKGKSQYYDWANITGIYKKDIKNFRRLCRSCHKLYDLGKINLRLEVI